VALPTNRREGDSGGIESRIFRWVLERHIILRDFMRSDLSLVWVRSFGTADSFGFEELPLLDQFRHAFTPGDFFTREAHVISRLAG
jgi:hypothetical protein